MSARSSALFAVLFAISGLLSSCATPTGGNIQTRIVGSWEAVSLTNINGSVRQEPMGPGLKGRLSMDPDGLFSIILMRAV
jgi:hypothetical protein